MSCAFELYGADVLQQAPVNVVASEQSTRLKNSVCCVAESWASYSADRGGPLMLWRTVN
jgi:hypothetical protein